MEEPAVEVYIAPHDREVCRRIVDALCAYFSITEKQLMTGTDLDIVNMRHLGFYLIKLNTTMNNSKIAWMFKKARSPVSHGINTITNGKHIYASVGRNLRKVAEMAEVEY